ncbi:MAG: sulfatase [Planctomycetaceae bacterium]
MFRHFVIVFGWSIVACVASASFAQAEARPNIVFIMADDLGWTDLGCQGSKYYRTPHIDRLASQGMRLTRFYQCQNCAPTRAALLSGQYAPRTGVYTPGTLARGNAADRRMEVPENETKLPLDRTTLAQALKNAGYATGMFGKWHLGDGKAYHPAQRGFDEAIVTSRGHFDFATNPKTDVPADKYLADFVTDRAVDFIDRHADEPFFLYLPHYAVHTPIVAKEEYVPRWKEIPPAGTHWNPVYAAMIQSLDESVGRVVAKLDELKLADKTIVIFTSDNGGLGGYHSTEPPSSRRGYTDNTPLRGGKGTLYEGGLRVPFIVRWPGVVKPGTSSDRPGMHVDIFPTLVDIARGELPTKQILDGVSLLPIFKDPAARLDRDAIYWHFPGYLESYVHSNGWRTAPVGAIHAGDYKLMEFFEDGRLEMYDLRADIGEKNDLAATMPEKAKELQSRLAKWRKEIGAAMPTPKSDTNETP